MGFKARILSCLLSLLRDRRGNFVFLSAGLMVPMLALAGGAIDLTKALEIRTQLAGAADAAALASLGPDSRFFRAVATKDLDVAMDNALAEAETVFVAGLPAGMRSATLGMGDIHLTSDRRAVMTFTYHYPMQTMFLKLLGIRYLPVNGKATAEVPLKRYTDVYLVLDNSPSMGVGATMEDIRRMQALTPDGCAFACHNLEDGPKGYYFVARANGIRMRVDLVREAAMKTVDAFRELQPISGTARMAVYNFGDDARERVGLNELAPLTVDTARLARAASGIDLMVTPFYWYNMAALTPMDDVFLSLNKKIENGGSGLTGGSREKVVVLVSDGVADAPKFMTPCAGPMWQKVRCQEPIELENCERLKRRGIKVAVLYTTFLPLPTNQWYLQWIRPFQDEIAPRMQACASPGLFFEVGFGHGIEDALRALFFKAVILPRVTS